MRNHGIRILVNAIILVAGWTGLMVANDMGHAEKANRVSSYHAEQRAAALAMVNEQVETMSKKYDRCTKASAPFLTDHIFIVGAHIAGKYDTGVVYEVTMGEAFMQPRGSIIVLAYCE